MKAQKNKILKLVKLRRVAMPPPSKTFVDKKKQQAKTCCRIQKFNIE